MENYKYRIKKTTYGSGTIKYSPQYSEDKKGISEDWYSMNSCSTIEQAKEQIEKFKEMLVVKEEIIRYE